MNSFETERRVLLTLKTDEIRHSGTSLYQHLINTGEILKAWHCDKYVVHAGLFHSMYLFNLMPTIASDSRRVLRMIVGNSAEQLVFDYTQIDQTRLSEITTEEFSQKFITLPTTDEKYADFSRHQVRILIHMIVANKLEEFSRLNPYDTLNFPMAILTWLPATVRKQIDTINGGSHE